MRQSRKRRPVAAKRAKPRVRVTTDGPYILSGRIPIQEQVIQADEACEAVRWVPGRRYAARGRRALCRCGRSLDKPFCDRTHRTVNFDGTEVAGCEPYLTKARRFAGPRLLLTDVEKLCASARFCLSGAGIWKLTLRSGRPGNREAAIGQALNCPAGRLVVWDTDGSVIEADLKPSIGVVEGPQSGVSGPLWVRGGIPVQSAAGRTYAVRNRVTLCRCGRSRNKPFCDGGHTRGKRARGPVVRQPGRPEYNPVG